jgi:hypothetical protein
MRRILGVIVVLGALAAPATALAISGVAGNAAQVEYNTGSQGNQSVLGEERSSPDTGDNAPLDTQEASPASVTSVSTSGSQRLPFTGYLVIGSLLTGVALLAGGAAFRRSLAR